MEAICLVELKEKKVKEKQKEERNNALNTTGGVPCSSLTQNYEKYKIRHKISDKN